MIDPITQNQELSSALLDVEWIMDVAHDKAVVPVCKEALVGGFAELLCNGSMGALCLKSLAPFGDTTGDRLEEVGVEELCGGHNERISDHGSEYLVPDIARHDEIPVSADDSPPLACESGLLLMDGDSQLASKEVAGPAIVIAAEEMECDASPSALVEGVEDIEVSFGDHGAVLEIEIEDVSEQEDRGASWNPLHEGDKAFTPLWFPRQVSVPEMRIRYEEDFRGRDADVIPHGIPLKGGVGRRPPGGVAPSPDEARMIR